MLAVYVTANLRYIHGGHLYQIWNISIVSRLSYQDVEEMVSVLLKPAMLLNGRLQFESHLWTFLKDIRTTTLGVFFFVALFYRSSSLSLFHLISCHS